MKTELYHVCKKDPKHKAWGVYSRRKGRVACLFRLVTVCLAHEAAVAHATSLTKYFPENEYSVQGETVSANLPDRYDP